MDSTIINNYFPNTPLPNADYFYNNNNNLNYNQSIYSSSSSSSSSAMGDFPEMYYRHSMSMTVVYCIAYIFVFIVGLIGNSFVILVVLRAPRMKTVTNFFIVNLALADILVIVFCLPATLMSNVFVRKWTLWWVCSVFQVREGAKGLNLNSLTSSAKN